MKIIKKAVKIVVHLVIFFAPVIIVGAAMLIWGMPD
jgi:hypothetical protein